MSHWLFVVLIGLLAACGPSPTQQSVTLAANTVALVTPSGKSAMNETFGAAQMTVENVITSGGQSGAAGVTAFTNCTLQANLPIAGIATRQLVAGTVGELVRLCGLVVIVGAETTLTFVKGTGVDCVTDRKPIAGPWRLSPPGMVIPFGPVPFLDGEGPDHGICVTNSAAANVTVYTRYAKY